jgi:probable HAF family extracellular repeat protein
MQNTMHCVEVAKRFASEPGLGRLGKMGGFFCLGLVLAAWGGLTTAQAQNTHYTVQDLGVVGANFFQPGQPFVISNNGWVAGDAGVGAAVLAVLWRDGKMTDIGDPGLGGNSIAYGVNQWGIAVGEAEDTSTDRFTSEDFCGFQLMGYSSSPTPCVPFIWREGEMVRLKTLGGANGVANQINRWSAIAGYAENTTKDPACPPPQEYEFKPVVWFGDDILPLPTAGTDPEGLASSINDLGQVVGASGTCTVFNINSLYNLQPVHALLWQNGRAIDLGNLGGALNNVANDINNRGVVVGGSDLTGDLTSHAFFWAPESRKMTDMGTLDGDYWSIGIGINDEGELVGASANADFTAVRAFVRQRGKLVDLNSLVVGDNPFPQGKLVTGGLVTSGLETACKINSKGEIVGIAVDPTGAEHSYMAIPVAD